VLAGVLVGTHGQAGRLPHEPPPGEHAPVEHEPPDMKQLAHSLSVWRHRTLPPRKQWQQHAPSPPRAERRVMAWSASDALSAMSTSVAYRPIRASHQPRHRIPTVDGRGSQRLSHQRRGECKRNGVASRTGRFRAWRGRPSTRGRRSSP
jgi:hypothetical protein